MDVVTSTPKARTRHYCEVCPDLIEPGASYVRVVTFDGGDVLTWKAHTECQDATNQAREDGYGDALDGTILGPDVVEWANENWHLSDAAAAVYHRYQRRKQ